MKRRGSALVSVLIASSLLLGIGTIVSATVVNTTKLNQRYSENIDLELAAKSALNYGIDYFKKNDITIPVGGKKDIPGMFGDYNNIKEKVEIKREGEDTFTITGIAILDRNSEVKAEESTVIKISNDGEITQEPETPGSGEESEEEESSNSTIAPQNILNIKKNLSWDYTGDLSFLKRVAFGEDLISTQWDLSDYIKNNKITSSDIVKDTDFIINENNVREGFVIPTLDEEVRSFDNLEVVTQELINDKSIDNKKYIVKGDVNISNFINLKDTTLVIEGNLIANHSLNIKLENSNLLVKGNVEISQDIRVESSNSFMDIYGDLKCNNGLVDFKASNNSIIKIKKDLIQVSNGISINLIENSIFDVGQKIEANNNINIIMRDSNIITRNGGIKAKNSELSIDGENSSILLNGALIGNGVKIKLNNSRINTIGVSANEDGNALNVDISLINTKALIYGIVKGNSLNEELKNSEIIYKGSLEIINRYTTNIKDSIVIINGNVKVNNENMDSQMNNSAIFILNQNTNVDINAVDVKNNFKLNNIENSYMYILGNLNSASINIDGDSNKITPSKEIMDRINLLIENN